MLNDAEKELFFHLHGQSGSFSTALFTAIFRADINNIQKLEMGFPDEVRAVQRYMHEDGYWSMVQKEMNS